MKNIFLVSLCISISLITWAQSGQKGDLFKNISKETGKTHVILIGVSEYTHFPKLSYSDDDARLMESYLSTWPNISIKTFIDDQAASKDVIGAEIDMTLNNEAVEGDRVIIYFSGHGDVDPKYNDGYLLLGSAQEPSAKTYRFNQALSMSQLEDMMNYSAKNGVQVILITDACKSGAILNARDANQRMLEIGSNTISLVSCGPSESSYESEVLTNGIFTYYLVQGLKGMADSDNDKNITYKELERYLEDNVDVAAKKEKGTFKQNPIARIGDKTKTIVSVDGKLLAEAEKREVEVENIRWNKAEHKNMASRGVKGNPVSFAKMTGNSSYMLDLMNQLVSNRVVFSDELNTTESVKIEALGGKMHSVSSSPIYDMSVSSDGNYIASPSGSFVSIFNSKMELVKKLKGHKGGVTSVAFRPNTQHVASGAWDNSVILWDVTTGNKVASIKKVSDEAYALCFVHENLLAVGTNKGDLYLWDLASEMNTKYTIGKSRISAIETSGTKLFIAMADGSIRIFDLNSKKEIKRIVAHKSKVNGLKYAPLSNQLFSVGNDKKLKCWDLESYTMVKSYPLNFGENRDIDLDPFENFCFVSSRRYDMDVIQLKENKTLSRMFSSKSSGLVSVLYNQSSSQVLIGDSKGRIHANNIRVEQNEYTALDIYDLLIARKDLEPLQYRIKGDLVMGLNKLITEVLNPLVNGDAVLPNLTDIKKAKRYSEKAFEISGDNTFTKKKLEINSLLLGIFEVLYEQDATRYQDALTKVNRITKLDPNGAYAYNISGVLLARLNKLSEAKTKAESAEGLAPLWAEAPCGTGKILFQERDYNGAELKFKETIEKGPQLSKGYYNLAKLYNYIGRVDDAEIEIEKARKIDPNVSSILIEDMKNRFLRGDISKVRRLAEQENLKDLPEAMIARSDVEFLERTENTQFNVMHDRYLKAYSIDSNSLEANLALGYFYLRILDNKKAQKFIDETFSKTTGDRPIKGKTMMKRECKRLFNKCEKMAPNDLRGVTGDWMTRGSDVSGETIQTAISRNNNRADIYTAIGRYYIFKEDYKNALKYLKKAISIDEYYYKGVMLYLEANKRIGKEKKNASLVGKIKADPKRANLLKYRKEITDFILLY